jgi:hypothetical protein
MSLWRVLLLGACGISAFDASTVRAQTDAARARCHRITARVDAVSVSEHCTSPAGLCTTGTVTGDSIVNGVFEELCLVWLRGRVCRASRRTRCFPSWRSTRLKPVAGR